MDKQNVVFTYNGISFSLKEEGNCNTCYNMGEIYRDILLSKIHQSQKTHAACCGQKKKGQMCESYDVPRIVKFIVTGSGMMVVGTEVTGGGELPYQVSVWPS